jgi:hypothetical protein
LHGFDEAGNHGLRRRALEGARRADGRDRAVNADGMQPMQITRRRQQRQRCPFEDLADADDRLSVEPVRDMPHQQHQQEHRQKLRKPNHPQGKGAAGEIVHLPTDRDGRHLKRDGRADARKPESRVGRLPKHRILCARLRSIFHRSLMDVPRVRADASRQRDRSRASPAAARGPGGQ